MFFKIEKKKISDKNKTFIIAEVGLAHSGNFKKALKYVKLISNFDVDAIKFQTHIASEESTKFENFRVRLSKKYKNRSDYWDKTSFNYNQWLKLKKLIKRKKKIFLSSPFSIKALQILEKLRVPAWKIASGEITNTPMIEKMIETRKPLLISTGLANFAIIKNLIKKIKKKHKKFCIMQCTSSYPAELNEIGLNLIQIFKKKFKCIVGYSDHSGDIFAPLAAVTLGAKVIEVHVSINKKRDKGPDAKASLDLQQLSALVKGIRSIDKIKSKPQNKDRYFKMKKKYSIMFGRSLVLNQDMNKNQIIDKNSLSYKKPGSGLQYKNYKDLLGKKLNRKLKKDTLIKFSHVQKN